MSGTLLLAACGGGDDATEAPATETLADDAGTDGVGGDDTEAAVEADTTLAPIDEQTPIEALQPASSFPIENAELAQSLAFAPDGTAVAVMLQDGPGDPIALRVYDASSGDLRAETDVDAVGLSQLRWSADGRIIAADSVEEVWRTWDGVTLAAAPTAPFDFACGFGQFDPNTAFHYSFDGDALCRSDPATGTVLRSADGVVVEPETRFWLRPERGEVVVEHYPDPDGPSELLTIDAARLEATGSTEVPLGTLVLSVGATTWLDDRSQAVLEPEGIPAPAVRDVPEVSAGGRFFWTANGSDDVVFYSAVDGSIVGAIPAGMNPVSFSGWTEGDTRQARLTSSGQIEVYDFPS